jgi:DNA-binding Xre family transcriptional regulator
MLTWKLRISVLWIFLAICQAAAMALFMLGPGVLRGLMAGQLWGYNTHSAAVQINIALFFLVPAAMAYLALVLNAAASRWANWRELQRLLAERGMVISAGKMSGLWSGQPNTVRLHELDVICAVLGCDVGELLLPDPVAVPESTTGESSGAFAEARAVTPRSRTGRSLPLR